MRLNYALGVLLCACTLAVSCEDATIPAAADAPQIIWTHKDVAGSDSQPYADAELAVFTTAFASRVVALDARSGRVRWQRALPQEGPYGLPIGNVVGFSDLMIVPAYDLYALDRVSGQIRWRFAPPEEYPAASSIALWEGRIFSPGARRVHAVDAATGRQIWSTDLGERPFAPVVADGVVYVVARGFLDPEETMLGEGHAWALDARDGRVLWKVLLPDSLGVRGNGGANRAGALTPELFIVASINRHVYGIERSTG